MRQKSMTSQNMEVSCKCNICKDTGWVLGENGYKRCTCYEKERIERLWKNFGVNPNEVKRLNEYVPFDSLTTKAKEKAFQYIKSFDEIKSMRENSYGLFGQAGAGKTHIVIAIGAALLNKNIKVIYMPYLETIRELKANSMDDEYYLKLSSRYSRAKLLIIDDLFKDKVKKGQIIRDRYGSTGLTEADMKHIYPILNYRYINYLPTLISTECTPNMLLDLDEALAGRILETCGNNITVFKGTNYNYRMKKFMR